VLYRLRRRHHLFFSPRRRIVDATSASDVDVIIEAVRRKEKKDYRIMQHRGSPFTLALLWHDVFTVRKKKVSPERFSFRALKRHRKVKTFARVDVFLGTREDVGRFASFSVNCQARVSIAFFPSPKKFECIEKALYS
jgi:hypothetical protein